MSCICSSRKSILKGRKSQLPKRITVTDHYTDLIQNGKVDPDGPAIIGEHGQVLFTSLQLDLNANKVAKAMRKHLGYWTSNNPDGDLVIAFSLHTSEHAILMMLAIMKLGATYLSLGTSYPEQQIVRLVGITRPLLVVTESDPTIAGRFACVKHICEIVNYDELFEAGQQSFDGPSDPVPLESLAPPWRRAACIVFTAGTIGEPHGVRIGHQAILNRLYWQFKALPYQNQEIACLSSLLVDAESVAEIFAPLLGNVPLYVIPRQYITKPEVLFTKIKELNISRITFTPNYFQNVLKLMGPKEDPENEKAIVQENFESLRYLIVSGDVLAYNLVEQFFANIGPLPDLQSQILLVYFYGASETMSEATYEIFEDRVDFNDKTHKNKVSGGQPIDNTTVYILDEDLNIVPQGTVGEIFIGGTSLAMGYSDKRDNDVRFVQYPRNKKGADRVFRTGDLGKITVADGLKGSRLYYQGRTDMLMKVGGKEVELTDIAAAIFKSEMCSQSVVLCYHRNREDQTAVAVCIMQANQDPESLMEFLKNNLDEYSIPDVYPVSELPYLPSGRLDRAKLLKMYKFRRMESTPEEWKALNFDVAERQAAKVLFEVISHTIGVSLRSILGDAEASYWSIGGNSLNALHIVHTIRENGYLISIDEFVQAESLSSIIRAMVLSSRYPVSNAELLMHICDLAESKYTLMSLKQEHKSIVIKLISKCHSEKNIMAKLIGTTETDYVQFLEIVWGLIIKEDLSVVAVDKTSGEISGVLLCTDVNAKHVRALLKHVRKPMSYCIEVFNACEAYVRESKVSKERGTFLQVFMIATDVSIESKYNIVLIEYLLKGTMQQGLLHGYSWALIMDVSSLIRDLCGTVLQYDLIAEQNLCSFVSKDKTKPFRNAGVYEAVRAYYRHFA